MATNPSSPPSTSPSPPSSPSPPTTTTTHLLALPATSTQQPQPHPTPYAPNPTPPKKPQPLPWTHEETITLIQTYQQKWYSLKKGQLKASQWEEVSLSVPSKTSTQCRHKMEKLRKRYRAERAKPYSNSWPYFQLMDSMERGPFPLNAQPVSAVHMLPQPRPHRPVSYSSHFSSKDDSDSDDNDISDQVGVGQNKLKSINNIVSRGMGVVYSSNNGSSSGVSDRNKRIPLGGGNERGMMPRVMMDSKKRRGYDEDSDDDEEDEDVDVDGEGEDDGGAGDGGKELALEIRGFTERFMRVEKMKIEMTREMERYRMDMEKRRMEMILSSQRKIVDTIGRAFRAHKRLNTGEEL